jgi:cytidyltransferase-like protein
MFIHGGTVQVGYLAGAFDLINVGDLDVISQARTRCTQLVVGVLSDETILKLTGRPPVVPLVERLALVQHLRGVDEVLVHDELDPSQFRDATAVFSALNGTAFFGDREPVLLTPIRRTASATLRRVLHPELEPTAA